MTASIQVAVAYASVHTPSGEAPGQDLLPRTMARRLNGPLRRAMGCALEALRQAGIERPDAIFFGTGLGCLADTQEFLLEIDRNAGSILPPTPFMRSTHNTVPGLLALALGVRGPNITHSQGLFSFHAALIHALLHLDEHPDHRVLVGASDEHLPVLDALRGQLPDAVDAQGTIGDGTAWFILDRTAGPFRIAEVIMQQAATLLPSAPADLELAGMGRYSLAAHAVPGTSYTDITGINQSAPALALAMGIDHLRHHPGLRHARVLDRLRSRVGIIRVERC